MADIVTTDQLLAEIADYWNKRPDSNLYKLVDIYNSGFNSIVNDLQTVDDWRAVNQAEGTTLDLIGEDEQAYRVTQDDNDYRFWIWIKFLIARAQGTYPSFMQINQNSLGADKDFKIWNTNEPHHVDIQLPWGYVSSTYMQKFLLKNLQGLLALGNWLDAVQFKSKTDLPLYIGVGAQSSWETTMRSKIIWWTGWKARTEEKPFAGIIGRMSDTSIWKAKTTIWWSGWEAKTTSTYYVGMAERYISSSIWSTAIN